MCVWEIQRSRNKFKLREEGGKEGTRERDGKTDKEKPSGVGRERE